jgi:hypothetical protein
MGLEILNKARLTLRRVSRFLRRVVQGFIE